MGMRSFFVLTYTSLIGILVGLQIFLFLRGPGSHAPSSPQSLEEDPGEEEYSQKKLDFIVSTEKCKIVKMDQHITWNNKGLVPRKQCSNRSASGFLANITNGILRLEKVNAGTNFSCCYKEIKRKQTPTAKSLSDWLVTIDKTCTPIPREGTPIDASFLKIKCKNGVRNTTDFVATVLPPERHSYGTRLKAEFWKNSETPRPPNVLLLHINCVSRLHMLRTLNLTRRLALDKSFVELMGYTRSGANLFSNMMTLLAGLPENEYPCWVKEGELDRCPFLWKNFSRRNYITGLAEDSPFLSIFNWNKIGFVKQPVDYYSRPLMVAAHNHYNISATYSRMLLQCMNGRNVFDNLYKYLEDFLEEVAGKVPYFMLASFKSYEGYTALQIGPEDKYLADFLSNVLTNPRYDANNTMIMLFSTNYAVRERNFETLYEDGLPMMLVRLPPSLSAKDPELQLRLKRNAGVLTTPFDIYATLVEVLGIDDSKGSKHEGYSLLREIPDRTCSEAGVPAVNCRCGWIPGLPPGQGVNPESEYSAELGKALVHHMNTILEPVLRKPLCERLILKETTFVQVLHEGYVRNGEKRVSLIEFVVGVEVYPSDARYEGVIREYSNSTRVVMGNITKVRGDKSESYCISNKKYKRFCSCFEHNLQTRMEKLKLLMKKSSGFRYV